MPTMPDMNSTYPSWPLYEVFIGFSDGSSHTVPVATTPGLSNAQMATGVTAMAQAFYEADWAPRHLVRVTASEVSLVSRPLVNLEKPPPGSDMMVSSITPNWGGVSGGTRVTIKGKGLSRNILVTFSRGGGVSGISVVDDETVTCETPDARAQGAGPSDVTVWANDPYDGNASLKDGFTYM